MYWLFLLFGDTASFWADQTIVIAKARNVSDLDLRDGSGDTEK